MVTAHTRGALVGLVLGLALALAHAWSLTWTLGAAPLVAAALASAGVGVFTAALAARIGDGLWAGALAVLAFGVGRVAGAALARGSVGEVLAPGWPGRWLVAVVGALVLAGLVELARTRRTFAGLLAGGVIIAVLLGEAWLTTSGFTLPGALGLEPSVSVSDARWCVAVVDLVLAVVVVGELVRSGQPAGRVVVTSVAVTLLTAVFGEHLLRAATTWIDRVP